MDPLDRLIEMARHASPVDRLRLERTITVIRQARLAVQLSHQAEQNAWEQLTQAKAASQRRREKGEGPPIELHIFGDRTPPGSSLSIRLVARSYPGSPPNPVRKGSPKISGKPFKRSAFEMSSYID